MVIEKRDDTLWADIFWEDLSTEAQTELSKYMGDNGNYDVFPIFSVSISHESS